MIVTNNITVYQCEHCKKKLFRKHAMELHEKFCSKNPENYRVCLSCPFMEEDKIIVYEDQHTTRYGKGFRCSKINQNIYHPKVEKKLLEKYPETFLDQIPMKKECELYRDGFIDNVNIFL